MSCRSHRSDWAFPYFRKLRLTYATNHPLKCLRSKIGTFPSVLIGLAHLNLDLHNRAPSRGANVTLSRALFHVVTWGGGGKLRELSRQKWTQIVCASSPNKFVGIEYQHWSCIKTIVPYSYRCITPVSRENSPTRSLNITSFLYIKLAQFLTETTNQPTDHMDDTKMVEKSVGISGNIPSLADKRHYFLKQYPKPLSDKLHYFLNQNFFQISYTI